MNRRVGHVAAACILLFALLAVAQARVQIAERSAIAAHRGNPRNALRLAHRGALLDASGAPLAVSRGGERRYLDGGVFAQTLASASPVYGESGAGSKRTFAVVP